jgi:hypothetical protein
MIKRGGLRHKKDDIGGNCRAQSITAVLLWLVVFQSRSENKGLREACIHKKITAVSKVFKF